MTIEEFDHGIYYGQTQWLSDTPPLCLVTVQLKFKDGKSQKAAVVDCNFDLLLPACIAGIKLGTMPRIGETLDGFATMWIVDGVEHGYDGEYSVNFKLKEI